jgi:hypothetical protein
VKSAIVFGGYGTFGSHVARELARKGVQVIVAGRDAARAETFARSLGPDHRGVAVDLTVAASCRAVLRQDAVAVHCAGPFAKLGPGLLDACLDVGCNYVDIAEDRGYTRLVRLHRDVFRERGLTAAYGCSSLPGISGALAMLLREAMPAPPVRARVTLFIGNNNPKGDAAVRSLLAGLGKPISTPQGTLFGFRNGEVVPLPAPFGPRTVYNFESPDYDLFPRHFGIRDVVVKVGFDLRLATAGLALLARMGSGYGSRTAAVLEWFGGWFRGLGTSGGAVMTELFTADGHAGRAALVARSDGQRMAALPCALAAQALCSGEGPGGVVTAYELFGPRLLDLLTAEGFQLHREPR